MTLFALTVSSLQGEDLDRVPVQSLVYTNSLSRPPHFGTNVLVFPVIIGLSSKCQVLIGYEFFISQINCPYCFGCFFLLLLNGQKRLKQFIENKIYKNLLQCSQQLVIILQKISFKKSDCKTFDVIQNFGCQCCKKILTWNPFVTLQYCMFNQNSYLKIDEYTYFWEIIYVKDGEISSIQQSKY